MMAPLYLAIFTATVRETDDITVEYDRFTTKSEANANAATSEIDDTTLTRNSEVTTLT